MKNKVKKITTILSICIISYTCYGQNINVDIATERNLMSKGVSAKIIAEGTPYIDENMQPLKIDQYEGQVYQGRYNAYNGEMEVKLKDNKVIALDKNVKLKVYFTNQNKSYETFTYETVNGITKRGFLVVLFSNDNYSLLKEEVVKYYKKQEAVSSYQQDKPATFRREDDSYYIKINDETKYLSQNKRDFLKTFPKQSTKLKSYIKEHNLKPKNEEDLVKLVEYLATL